MTKHIKTIYSLSVSNIWLKASIGSVLGTIVGAINMMVVGTVLSILWDTTGLFVAAAISGAIAGAIEGSLLRRYTRPAIIWVAASCIGWVAVGLFGGELISLLPNSSINRWIPISTISGAIVGAIQWLVLRRSIRQGFWWIFINAGTWTFLAIICIILFGRLIGLSSW
jgi:hypothetical protein